MGISSHEMLLIMRARDEASRVVRGLGGSMRAVSAQTAIAAQQAMAHGTALMGAGTAMIATGVATLAVFNDMTQAAADYSKQVALTATQLDGVKLSLKDLSDMGLRTAKEFPVQFDQIQGSLYDIFSSLETNGPEAEIILKGIAKAAVAGNVEMETAGRANIAIMNAWKMKGNDINRVNDVMFQLVRKGVGTYDEFGKSIGKSIPSAVKAGQSVEDLAGAMAFMTRNGLSTSMASTSVARAFDALSKTKTQENFKKIGISVLDAGGKFRPFANIMEDLRGKLLKLSPAARAAQLDALFKGSGGTIQAMRVFNLAVNDTGGLLQTLSKDMLQAGGATEEAYQLMSNTPEAKLQALKNQYQVMSVELGNNLLPAKLKLIELLSRVLNAFNNLSPGVKRIIAVIGVLAATFSVIVGAVLMVAGMFLMLQGAALLAGTSLAALAVPVAVAIAILAALVVAGILVYKNWDVIKAKAIQVWNTVWQAMQPFVQWLKDTFLGAWRAIATFAQGLWSQFGSSIIQTVQIIWSGIKGAFDKIKTAFMGFAQLGKYVVPMFTNIGRIITGTFKATWPLIKSYVTLLVGNLVPAFRVVGVVVREVFNVVGTVISGVITVIRNVVGMVMAIFSGDWKAAWDYFLQIFVSIGRLLSSSLTAVVTGIGNILASLVTNVYRIFTNMLTQGGNVVKNFVKAIIGFFTNLWDVLVGHSIVPDMVNAIIRWFLKLPATIIGMIAGFVNNIIKWFANLASNVISKIASFATNVINRFLSLVRSITSSISGFVSRIIGFFASLAATVISKVASMASSVIAKFAQFVSSAVSKTGELPRRAASALSSLGSSITNVASRAWSSLTAAVSNGVTNATGAAGRLVSGTISALSGMFSAGLSAGSNVVSGLVSGIQSGISWVTSAASNLANAAKNAAKSALGIKSPSKVFAELGKYVGQGFVIGLKGSSKDVSKASTHLAKKVEAMFKDRMTVSMNGQLDRWKAIAKKAKTGADAYKNALKQIENARVAIAKSKKGSTAYKNAQKSLSRWKKEAAKNKAANTTYINATNQISKLAIDRRDLNNKAYASMSRFMRSYVNTNIKKLENLKKRSESYVVQIKNAQANLDTLLKARQKTYDDLYKGMNDGNNIVEAGKGDIVAYMKDQDKRIKKYGADLTKLKSLGLNNTTMQQLAEAGLEGENAVRQLLSGGTGIVRQVNSLTSSISSNSAKTANMVADSMYKTGIQAAQGLVKGLNAKKAAVDKAALALANTITARVKKALGIKSPSRVLMSLGNMTGAGFAEGLLATKKAVDNAVKAVIPSSFDAPTISAPVVGGNPGTGLGPGPFYGGSGNSGGTQIFQNIEVNTQEIDPVKHAADLGWELAKRV